MFRILALALVSLFLVSAPASAKVDLSGKTITWVVPFKEGGGTSRFARFIPVSYTHLTLPTILLV